MTRTDSITAGDGTRLKRYMWDAAEDPPRALILLVHGVGEHAGRWSHVGEALSRHGFTVHAPDLRGHGASGGPRAHVDTWDEYLDDVAVLLGRLREVGRPVVLYGHSLGGLIALTYVLSNRPAPDLLVLSAPALRAEVPAVSRLLARLLSHLAPKLRLSPAITGDQLARDPAVGTAYFADPLVQTRLTTRLGAETMRAMRLADAAGGGLAMPTLVVHGGSDTLVPTASSEPLHDLPQVRRIVFPEFRHESHNEDGGRVLLETVSTWIDRHLADQAG